MKHEDDYIATLRNVHVASLCEGEYCPIHNRSDHHMRSWTMFCESGMMLRQCPTHEILWLDPDDPKHLTAIDFTEPLVYQDGTVHCACGLPPGNLIPVNMTAKEALEWLNAG